jgi:hypothetical protein
MNPFLKSLGSFFTTPLFYLLIPLEILIIYFFIKSKESGKSFYAAMWMVLLILVFLFQYYGFFIYTIES